MGKEKRPGKPQWSEPRLDHIGAISDVAGRPVPVGPQAASRTKS
ncbi:MAG: hypothetical protein WAT93_03265 [Pontixanthobacter sp.]